jgi:hypothetical protein
MLFSFNSKSQLKKYVREVDSLSTLYGKKVIGYSKSITTNDEPRESFLIFYIEHGEVEDELVWTKIIDSDVKILLLRDFDDVIKDTVVIRKPINFHINIPIYYDTNNLIGSMKNGFFSKIQEVDYTKYAVSKETRLFLKDDKMLDKWLKMKFGDYYKGIK